MNLFSKSAVQVDDINNRSEIGEVSKRVGWPTRAGLVAGGLIPGGSILNAVVANNAAKRLVAEEAQKGGYGHAHVGPSGMGAWGRQVGWGSAGGLAGTGIGALVSALTKSNPMIGMRVGGAIGGIGGGIYGGLRHGQVNLERERAAAELARLRAK